MRRSVIGWIVAAVLAVGGAALAYLFWFAGGSGEPTTDLTTPELAATTTTGAPDATTSRATTHTGETGDPVSFVLDQDRSTARFEIDEVLNGNPSHVVGTTDQVVGQVRLDPTDLSSAEFSDIVVNARTLATGSDRRDRAIRGPIILDSGSDANELITLVVTSVNGLSGALTVGESVEFTLTGDITIRGTTASVTFDAVATLVDDATIEGTAVAGITRDMFEIGIPSVPNVADVTNEVLLGIEFVAVAG